MPVPFVDLKAQYAPLRDEIRAKIDEVCDAQWFIGGPELQAFEPEFADYCHATWAVGLSSGTDALLVALMALEIGPGDAVVTSDGAYPTFNYHVAGFGGDLHKVPYTDDHEDPGALFARAAETGAKLVYLANPDNPIVA